MKPLCEALCVSDLKTLLNRCVTCWHSFIHFHLPLFTLHLKHTPSKRLLSLNKGILKSCAVTSALIPLTTPACFLTSNILAGSSSRSTIRHHKDASSTSGQYSSHANIVDLHSWYLSHVSGQLLWRYYHEIVTPRFSNSRQ